MDNALATHQNIRFLQKASRKRTYENCKTKISYGLPLPPSFKKPVFSYYLKCKKYLLAKHKSVKTLCLA
jgi:hypothetical protein